MEALNIIRRKIREYDVGDRPSSPPSWMLEIERELLRIKEASPAPAPARVTAENVLSYLRRVSAERCKVWMKGQVPPLTFQSTELAEEAGEVCGAVKKLARHEMGVAGGIADTTNLREELADVIICADLIAARYGIDLWEAICIKFNATSQKHGFPHRLFHAPGPTEPVYVGDLKNPPFDGELKPPGHSDWTKLADLTSEQRAALSAASRDPGTAGEVNRGK